MAKRQLPLRGIWRTAADKRCREPRPGPGPRTNLDIRAGFRRGRGPAARASTPWGRRGRPGFVRALGPAVHERRAGPKLFGGPGGDAAFVAQGRSGLAGIVGYARFVEEAYQIRPGEHVKRSGRGGREERGG